MQNCELLGRPQPGLCLGGVAEPVRLARLCSRARGRRRHLQQTRLRHGRRTIWGSGILARRGRDAVGDETMRKSDFALRLQPSLLEEAR